MSSCMHCDVWSVLGTLLLAAFLGIVGQLIRIVAGLKKESDRAKAANQPFGERFSAPQLWISLGISLAVGAIAGVLSALQATDIQSSKGAMLALIGAGYSGTDFIEAFMKKALPG
jgi:hypothetical protein